MSSIDEITAEMQKIDSMAITRAERMRHIGELANDIMNRVQADFSDQQAGKALINALSLIRASCEDAAASITGLNSDTRGFVSKLRL